MSNPADNTPGCPVCGLAPQVNSCNVPLGRCYSPHAYVPMGTDLLDDPCEICDAPAYHSRHAGTVHVTGGGLDVGIVEVPPIADSAEDATRVAQAFSAFSVAPAHPLPWRWECIADSDGARIILYDAAGCEMMGVRLLSGDASLNGGSPYIRAVTERAGAMEALLRKHQWSSFTPEHDRICCPECSKPMSQRETGTRARHGEGCAIGTLLADIEDAAKAKG